ncbi:MAG: hypothetical protein KY452_05295, partial [Actinobacteria bacterium]|nr:hypothetical protein [Actinomycetota bacterium]
MVVVPALLSAAQSEPSTTEVGACGENPGAACLYVLERTDNAALAKAVDFLLAKPLKIALILVLAWILARLARRAIGRFVRSFEQPGVQNTIGSLRDKTPAALLSTSP